MNSRAIPAPAKWLGYAGVLPFAALALLHVFGGPSLGARALHGFLAYGAVIQSFLGGIRWGVASRAEAFGGAQPLLSVLPSLWAVFWLVWPNPAIACWGMLAGFAAMGAVDRWLPSPGGADWMIVLRTRLTSAVLACHGLLIASLLMR